MSAIVISLDDERERQVKIQRLARQVERDLQRVLSHLKLTADRRA